MNDRIRLLAQQAGLYAFVSDAGVDPDIEKFAELIVKDCADFADEHNDNAEGVNLGVGRAIKEHFGVEE